MVHKSKVAADHSASYTLLPGGVWATQPPPEPVCLLEATGTLEEMSVHQTAGVPCVLFTQLLAWYMAHMSGHISRVDYCVIISYCTHPYLSIFHFGYDFNPEVATGLVHFQFVKKGSYKGFEY